MSQQIITIDQVITALDQSDLKPRKKRSLKRRLKRKRVQQTVLDELTSRATAEGYIIVGEDATVQVDWDGLISFIERLIPLIIKLIGLFG